MGLLKGFIVFSVVAGFDVICPSNSKARSVTDGQGLLSAKSPMALFFHVFLGELVFP